MAQIEQATGRLVQGLGFSTAAAAEAHMEAFPDCYFVSTEEFVSPATHALVEGAVVRKTA